MTNSAGVVNTLDRAMRRDDLHKALVIAENSSGKPELFLESNDPETMLTLLERAKQALIGQMGHR